MTRPRGSAQPPAARAMGDAELGHWLRARRARGLLPRTLPMLDGFVTAMAAGPLGLDPIKQIRAVLGVDRRAFDVGGTPEFAAIKAMADRFNTISRRLGEGEPTPLHKRKPNGDIDASEWCEGFLAAVNRDRRAWKDVIEPTAQLYGLMLPILIHCKTSSGEPLLGPPRPGIETQIFLKQAYTDIPMSVRAIREHYHVTHYDQPRPRARNR
jgi:uncharacterized protein